MSRAGTSVRAGRRLWKRIAELSGREDVKGECLQVVLRKRRAGLDEIWGVGVKNVGRGGSGWRLRRGEILIVDARSGCMRELDLDVTCL